MELSGKHLVVGMTGGIAAYKVCELVRRLQDAGATVQVVMTDGAQRFVTTTTMQALSGRPVATDQWDATGVDNAMPHIALDARRPTRSSSRRRPRTSWPRSRTDWPTTC